MQYFIYRIAGKFGGQYIWRASNYSPNLCPCQIFPLYGIYMYVYICNAVPKHYPTTVGKKTHFGDSTNTPDKEASPSSAVSTPDQMIKGHKPLSYKKSTGKQVRKCQISAPLEILISTPEVSFLYLCTLAKIQCIVLVMFLPSLNFIFSHLISVSLYM